MHWNIKKTGEPETIVANTTIPDLTMMIIE